MPISAGPRKLPPQELASLAQEFRQYGCAITLGAPDDEEKVPVELTTPDHKIHRGFIRSCFTSSTGDAVNGHDTEIVLGRQPYVLEGDRITIRPLAIIRDLAPAR